MANGKGGSVDGLASASASASAGGFMSALRRFVFTGSTALHSSLSASGDGGGGGGGGRGGDDNDDDDVSRRRRGRGGVFVAPPPKRSSNQLVIANDYRANDRIRSSDPVRPSNTSSSSAATPTATIVGGDMGGGGEGRGGGGSACLSDAGAAALGNVMHHRAWKLLVLACILLLLVGPSISTIWMPKSTDAGVLILFICSIIVLVVDIFVRSIVDETYLLSRNRESWRGARCGRMNRLFHVGSFAFWFDLVRTITYREWQHPSSPPSRFIPLLFLHDECTLYFIGFHRPGHIDDYVCPLSESFDVPR